MIKCDVKMMEILSEYDTVNQLSQQLQTKLFLLEILQ